MPKGTVAPYNAQATVHFYDSFWGLLLPMTVAGRVSDIYRSYFSQILFPMCQLNVGFLPRPVVVQERNPHNFMADFNAEQDLYTKVASLLERVKVLSSLLAHKKTPLPEAMELVWVDMYERGFIELDDVTFLHNWIEALGAVGYKFPIQCSGGISQSSSITKH